jgi:hypothetical protein
MHQAFEQPLNALRRRLQQHIQLAFMLQQLRCALLAGRLQLQRLCSLHNVLQPNGRHLKGNHCRRGKKKGHIKWTLLAAMHGCCAHLCLLACRGEQADAVYI